MASETVWVAVVHESGWVREWQYVTKAPAVVVVPDGQGARAAMSPAACQRSSFTLVGNYYQRAFHPRMMEVDLKRTKLSETEPAYWLPRNPDGSFQEVALGPVKTWFLVGKTWPLSRLFRETWRSDGTTMWHELGLCRQWKLRELREERNNMLVMSDGPFLRGLENGEPMDSLTDRRKRLRDAPVAMQAELERLTTVESIHAYKPFWR